MTRLSAVSPLPPSRRASIADRTVEAPLILVADDHDDSRFIARIVLESSGFRVVEARTGREALSMARCDRPDVMVLDIIMPELTGWEVARALRAEARGNQLAIIAVTALSDEEDRAQTMASGCDDMLVKPVHPRALIHVVRRHIARNALAQSQ
jgi:DNA-binding response OmpR family regulator